MQNLVLFFNQFMSYLLVFGLMVVLVIIASIIGVKIRISKNKKEAVELEDSTEHSVKP